VYIPPDVAQIIKDMIIKDSENVNRRCVEIYIEMAYYALSFIKIFYKFN
jgi:hypothetical protein